MNLRVVCFALLGSVSAFADVFYAIGPDKGGVPRNVEAIPPGGPAPTSLFNLGDGSLGFNGGLTYRPVDGKFYAIANDNSGQSTLQSFTLSGGGAVNNVLSLGTGFLSGLTYDSANGSFYAIAEDASSSAFLDKIDLATLAISQVKNLGPGFEGGGLFNGGLTFNPNDGLLYAMGFDAMSGASRLLYSISTTTYSVTPLFGLGDGSISFNGGLLFDPGSGRFYAISNDGGANSTLDHFSLAGGGAFTTDFALGQGFVDVGLTDAPSAVPEPSSLFLVISLSPLLLGKKLSRRRKNKCRNT